mgnify:CR=1 FL=1
MNRNSIKRRASKIERSWADEARETAFGELTLDEYKAVAAEAEQAEEEVLRLENRLAGTRSRRDAKLTVLKEHSHRVYHGVQSHPLFGPDCPMLRRMGYVIDSERMSGLTRKTEDLENN